MLKRILILFLWFSGTWITYSTVIITFNHTHNHRSTQVTLVQAQDNTHPIPTFTPNPFVMTEGDARPILLAKFLAFYKSPLKPYDYWGKYLVTLADHYSLDYRLIPAIAMQESNLCKQSDPTIFNCLGLGIHKRGTWAFERYEDNFAAAAKILKENYLNKGYVTPEQIQTKYTPSSNGSWQFAVNHFMDKISQGNY